jgi:hypothetical protein
MILPNFISGHCQLEEMESAICADSRDGGVFGLFKCHGKHRARLPKVESHGETGFGLVYPSLRILMKLTRSSSC